MVHMYNSLDVYLGWWKTVIRFSLKVVFILLHFALWMNILLPLLLTCYQHGQYVFFFFFLSHGRVSVKFRPQDSSIFQFDLVTWRWWHLLGYWLKCSKPSCTLFVKGLVSELISKLIFELAQHSVWFFCHTTFCTAPKPSHVLIYLPIDLKQTV